MAKEKVKSIVKTFSYVRDTKGTWVYSINGKEGERHSGTNALYLLKAEYPERPSDNLKIVITIE